MNNMVKYGTIGVCSIIVLFVVTVSIFLSTFDPNEYKDRIAKVVLEETGRTLTFDGDLKLLAFPRLGVALGGLHLSNNAAFGPKPMISVDSARVTVRSLPLLLGRIRFGTLALDGLVLNLSRDAHGATNWADLVGRENSEQQDTHSFPLEVDSISVTNGSLVWDDRMTDSRSLFHDMTVTTGKIAEGTVFPVDLTLAFDCHHPDAMGTLSLKGLSSIDLRHREYMHMDMHLAVSASGKDIPGGKVDLNSSFDFLTLDFTKEFAQVAGFECAAYGANVHLDGTLSGMTQGVKAATASVVLDPLDIKKVLTALGENPPVTADPTALTRVGGSVVVDFETDRFMVQTLKADVDGTRLVGHGHVDLGEDSPFCFVRLDAEALDLDRYLPSWNAKSTADVKDGLMDDTILPVLPLRRLNLDLETKIAELKLGGARLANVVAVVHGDKGVIQVDPLSAAAYGGTLELKAAIDARDTIPQTRLNVAIAGVDVGALDKDVNGKTSYAGTADYSSATTGRGSQLRTMLPTLNGNITFHLTDGVFPGVDLVRMARSTHSSKAKQGKVVSSSTDATKFGSISGTGIIKNGVVYNKDLEVKAPGLRAGGNGTVSLVTSGIDYLVKAKLVPQAEGQGGKSSGELFGVLVPIHVTGTLNNPHYWVSVTEYVKALGGVVIDTVDTLFGGVKSVVKGVGSVLE